MISTATAILLTLQNTYFVAPTGSDANPGTESRPWATLSKAVDTAIAGQTVRFRAGTYLGYKQFVRSGTAAAPITFEAYPGELAVFDGSNTASNPVNPNSVLALFEIHASHIVVRGLEFRNAASQSIYVGEGTHDNLIERVHIQHGYRVGVLLYKGSNHRVTNCTIHDLYDYGVGGTGGGGNADGIAASAGNARPFPDFGHHTITFNVVYNCSDDGIDAWSSRGNIIEGNTVYGVGYGNASNGGSLPSTFGQSAGNGNGFKLGAGGDGSGNNLVVNNVSYSNRVSGFDGNGIINGGNANTLYNNTSYNNPRGFRAMEAAVIAKNNIAFACTTPVDGVPGTSQNNSWDLGIEDPLFASVNPASASFLRLSKRSPALDTGLDLGAYGVKTDLAGTKRPQGRGYDLGAHEFYLERARLHHSCSLRF